MQAQGKKQNHLLRYYFLSACSKGAYAVCRHKDTGVDSTKPIKLADYEKMLRQEAEKALGIKIPVIPGNLSTDREVIFLERLLHANNKGDVEQLLWKKYGNYITDLHEAHERMYKLISWSKLE